MPRAAVGGGVGQLSGQAFALYPELLLMLAVQELSLVVLVGYFCSGLLSGLVRGRAGHCAALGAFGAGCSTESGKGLKVRDGLSERPGFRSQARPERAGRDHLHTNCPAQSRREAAKQTKLRPSRR